MVFFPKMVRESVVVGGSSWKRVCVGESSESEWVRTILR
jgi:hypothetical protein